MGCVYFVRHGQTIWNVENKICGATDIALTKTGHEQAIETGKKILDEVTASEKTYILVAHNGISRVVHSYFYEMTNEEFAAFGVKNCSITKYEF